MKPYQNDFVYGRDRLIKLLVATAACAVLSLLTPMKSYLNVAFMCMTVVLFVTAVWVTYKYCRCPSCGKMIVFGVAVVKTCPRCHKSLTSGKKVKKSKVR